MPKCESDESIKKQLDGIRLNPKCFDNGSSAAYSRIGNCSTTIPVMGVGPSGLKRAAPEMGDDIVLTRMKIREVHK